MKFVALWQGLAVKAAKFPAAVAAARLSHSIPGLVATIRQSPCRPIVVTLVCGVVPESLALPYPDAVGAIVPQRAYRGGRSPSGKWCGSWAYVHSLDPLSDNDRHWHCHLTDCHTENY